jgi:glycosyltransferase involved in cell wall biosynthesis
VNQPSLSADISAYERAGPHKKLLFVTDVFPYPLDRGERVRVFNLLEACAQGFEVTFVGPRPSDANLAHMPASITHAVLVDLDGKAAFDLRVCIDALRSSLGMPFGKMLRYRMQFLQALKSLDLSGFNLIWAERPHIARLFRAERARALVDFDDLEHIKLMRAMRLQRPSLALVHNAYRYLIYRGAELRGYHGFLRTVVCSHEDRAYLQGKGARNVQVVPNGAVIPKMAGPRRSRQPGEALRVVFIGNMEYPPNREAVRFFAEEVLPATRGIVESFGVIGPNAQADLVKRYAGRVHFRGFVDDLGAALAQYDVMVAPIRFGSGTKLKVLDAMAHCLPLVSTAYGAEGLALVDGVHALIASTPAAIVQALERLAQSPELGVRIAAEAYALACKRFSWASIQALLSSELLDLAGRDDRLVVSS